MLTPQEYYVLRKQSPGICVVSSCLGLALTKPRRNSKGKRTSIPLKRDKKGKVIGNFSCFFEPAQVSPYCCYHTKEKGLR